MGNTLRRWIYVAIVVDGRFMSSPSNNGMEWRYKAEASGGTGSALTLLTDPADSTDPAIDQFLGFTTMLKTIGGNFWVGSWAHGRALLVVKTRLLAALAASAALVVLAAMGRVPVVATAAEAGRP